MTAEIKSTIIGFFVQQKTTNWIAKRLKLDPKKVDAVIKRFGEQLNTASFSSASNNEDAEEEFNGVPEAFIKEAQKQLKEAGLVASDIAKVLDRALTYAEAHKIVYKDSSKFYTDCIKNMKTDNFLIKTTGNGNGGVAIMTKGVSDRIDKGMRRSPQKQADHIFKPKG